MPCPQREHLVEQLSGDALPLEGWRNADLVDLEFSRLVRVSVDHRRALSHHLVACERDNHEMAGFRQIGGEAFGINRLVEDVYGNAMEDCSIVKG
jgi:hypothetical protein